MAEASDKKKRQKQQATEGSRGEGTVRASRGEQVQEERGGGERKEGGFDAPHD